MDRLRQLEYLVRKVEQLLVLFVLFLHGLPLLVGDHLTLGVCPVLADHHEGREEDRLERDDHRQQPTFDGSALSRRLRAAPAQVGRRLSHSIEKQTGPPWAGGSST